MATTSSTTTTTSTTRQPHTIDMSGYLEKKGRSQMSSWRWKRCWCTLQDNIFSFSNSQEITSIKKPVDMALVEAVYRDPSTKKLTAFTLEMKKGERRSFNATSQEECSKWISCLQIAINESEAAARLQDEKLSQENHTYITATQTGIIPRVNDSDTIRQPTVYSEPWDSSHSKSTFYTQMSKKTGSLPRKQGHDPPQISPVWYASSEVVMKKFNFSAPIESIAEKSNDSSLQLPESKKTPPDSPIILRSSTIRRTSPVEQPKKSSIDSSPEISDVSDSDNDDSDDAVTISDIDDNNDDLKGFPDHLTAIPKLIYDGLEDESLAINELRVYLMNNNNHPFVEPRTREQGFYMQQLRDVLATLNSTT